MSGPVVSVPTLVQAHGERCSDCHIPIRGQAVSAPKHERPGLYDIDCWDRRVKEEREQYEAGAGSC